MQIGRIVFGSQIKSVLGLQLHDECIVADEYKSVPTVIIDFDFSIEKLMTPRNAFSTKTEKRLRVMIGDLLVLSCANRARLLQVAQSFDLRGLIIVAVVGTNRKIILS